MFMYDKTFCDCNVDIRNSNTCMIIFIEVVFPSNYIKYEIDLILYMTYKLSLQYDFFDAGQ